MQNLAKLLTKNEKPAANWINITGIGKRRKTLTALEIAEKCNSLYIDLERGTDVYKSTVAHVANAGEINTLIKAINADKAFFDVIIIDPLDDLAAMIIKGVLSYNNQSDLSEIKKQGVGNGWTIVYNSFTDKIKELIRHCKILITITHLKLRVISKDETSQISTADFNLIGQMKSFLNDKADAHLIFEQKKEKGGKVSIKISTSSDTHRTTFGSRGGVLDNLFNIKNPEDFKKFILESVGVDDVDIPMVDKEFVKELKKKKKEK